jgi:probable phosphoglycerate mutase
MPELPNIEKIYCSPSGRTMKTANIIFPGVEIHCDDRLREIDLGDWEGRLQSDLDEEDPDIHSSFWTSPHRYQERGRRNLCSGCGTFSRLL